MAIIARSWWRSPRMRESPVDNPATHLELTMVHEAMVLEFRTPSGMIEFGAFLKLLLYVSLIVCVFLPGRSRCSARAAVVRGRRRCLCPQTRGRRLLLALFETATRRCGCFVSAISRCSPDAGPARDAPAVRVKEPLIRCHSLGLRYSRYAGRGLVLISFMMLYQDRLYSLLNVFAFMPWC